MAEDTLSLSSHDVTDEQQQQKPEQEQDGNQQQQQQEEQIEEHQDVKKTLIKCILLGDSAVGKSKLVERFLMDGYQPQQLSTYALTLFRYDATVDGKKIPVDFWDTAGQERFSSMHPSYYHQAHACIIVFDCTRKITYKNLPMWLKELREYRENIPVIVVGNKIDIDYSVTKKAFQFPKKHGLPFYFVSASDGTNVVKVFNETIKAAVDYRAKSTDFLDEVMDLLCEDLDDVAVNDETSDTNSKINDANGSIPVGNRVLDLSA